MFEPTEFPLGSSKLAGAQTEPLLHVAEFMKRMKHSRFVVIGKVSLREGKTNAYGLARRRARAVKAWLQKHGIEAARLQMGLAPDWSPGDKARVVFSPQEVPDPDVKKFSP